MAKTQKTVNINYDLPQDCHDVIAAHRRNMEILLGKKFISLEDALIDILRNVVEVPEPIVRPTVVKQ